MYSLFEIGARNGYRSLIVIAIGCICSSNRTIEAQSVPPQWHVDPLEVQIGTHDGNGEQAEIMFQQFVDRGNAPWIQLTFDQVELGQSSFVRITSAANGDLQELDARMMRTWNSASGIFQGGRLLVELVVAPHDKGVSLEIHQALVGDRERPQDHGHQETICGDMDNRVLSNDSRVGRLFFGGCTTWLASNGSCITAGHCSPPSGVVEFNVPLSTPSGTPVPAAIEDQYPITGQYVDFFNDGPQDAGRDWGVFSIGRNSQTGAKAHAVQGYIRSTNIVPAIDATLRVTGFGTDSSPLEHDEVQQTSTGTYEGEITDTDSVYLFYRVDTEPASSGSPVLWEVLDMAIAVHTNGGCDTASDSANGGTSLELNEFETAINLFWGTGTAQVDNAHPHSGPFPLPPSNGSILRPWRTLVEGVADVATGGVLTIVEGDYDEPMTITKAMTIQAPAGTVTIGQ